MDTNASSNITFLSERLSSAIALTSSLILVRNDSANVLFVNNHNLALQLSISRSALSRSSLHCENGQDLGRSKRRRLVYGPLVRLSHGGVY